MVVKKGMSRNGFVITVSFSLSLCVSIDRKRPREMRGVVHCAKIARRCQCKLRRTWRAGESSGSVRRLTPKKKKMSEKDAESN